MRLSIGGQGDAEHALHRVTASVSARNGEQLVIDVGYGVPKDAVGAAARFCGVQTPRVTVQLSSAADDSDALINSTAVLDVSPTWNTVPRFSNFALISANRSCRAVLTKIGYGRRHRPRCYCRTALN